MKNIKSLHTNNLGVPQGSGYALQSFCEKAKRISTPIPHAKTNGITNWSLQVIHCAEKPITKPHYEPNKAIS